MDLDRDNGQHVKWQWKLVDRYELLNILMDIKKWLDDDKWTVIVCVNIVADSLMNSVIIMVAARRSIIMNNGMFYE